MIAKPTMITQGLRGASAGGAMILLALTMPSSASQKTPQKASLSDTATAPVVLLHDMTGKQELVARGADKAFIPASLVKVMTAYIVLDQVKAGKLTLDRKITVPADLVARWRKWPRASSLRLRAGETPTIGELLHGAITVSGNDAAELLAIASDGSTAAFVTRMNRTAKAIGMTNSRIGTVTGWPDGGETRVTARDLARLTERLIRDHPAAYARFFGSKSLTRRAADGSALVMANRNPLLAVVPGADGLKTGHTAEAGYTLLGSARRDGRRMIVVIAGATSEAQRRREGAALLEGGFAAAGVKQ